MSSTLGKLQDLDFNDSAKWRRRRKSREEEERGEGGRVRFKQRGALRRSRGFFW